MFDLEALRGKRARFGIGLMSGSSCDGIDAALVRLKGTGEHLAMKLVAYKEFPYETAFRTQLLNEHLSAREACFLDFELGARFGEAAADLIEGAKAEGVTVDFVASHGHTISHFPPGGKHVGTMQIGQPALIAERTGLPVVSDFRPRDMAAGGQGAPLVPYADWVLFRKPDRTAACLNIGGIANFTVVTPAFEDVIAFDTGPGNMAIDGAVRLLTRGGAQMDKDGRLAAKGIVIDEFLDYLLSHQFFAQEPPKSTGREDFGVDVYLKDALANRQEYSLEDLLATVTEGVGRSIADAYNRFIRPDYEVHHVIVSGGGALNRSLMRILKARLSGVKVFSSDQYGIPHNAREAIAFAILGNETLCGTPANVPSATGARHPVLLGNITPA